MTQVTIIFVLLKSVASSKLICFFTFRKYFYSNKVKNT